MNQADLRQQFLEFFKQNGHAVVPSSSLLPADPSVLLTTAGMQQFKPYYTGEADPEKDFGARNTASAQKSFRTTDIDEVGDETHLTFFEMLGNFSFGGYQKREAITLAYRFITQELKLPISYVTIFEGSALVPKDEESKAIWRELGVEDVREEGMNDVFWGPTGSAGPCGPTTEIYCKNSAGRDVEIWNIVFNQFFYPGTREELLAGVPNKKLEPLPQFGVDTGMGLERLAMIVEGTKNIFETSLFGPILKVIPAEFSEAKRRIIADHGRAVCFLIADGVRPDNKGAGYVLRRLLRRLIVTEADYAAVIKAVVGEYERAYPELKEKLILTVVKDEAAKFGAALQLGLKELKKLKTVTAESAFKIYETYGLPYEVIKDHAPDLQRADFEIEFAKHQSLSRASAEGKFKGGLADHEPPTVKLHTAHHLLLAALKKVLGPEVKQRGSNINQERLRIDFAAERKLTPAELEEVANLVNGWIKADLPVTRQELPRGEAERLGAEMEFGQKYGEVVSVYFIADVSKEFCGGPHMSRTGELGLFKIQKEEAVAQGVRRIKAVLI